MMHPKFGAVTCCPSNIGTGMRGSVHILVPKLIASIGFDTIDKLARERNCQARGSSGEHSAVVDRIDISNWRRIGFPEYELVQDMINCANFLAAEEDKAPELKVACAPCLPFMALFGSSKKANPIAQANAKQAAAEKAAAAQAQAAAAKKTALAKAKQKDDEASAFAKASAEKALLTDALPAEEGASAPADASE